MTVTVLQLVNSVLKRTGEIAGDSEELATSTVTSTATGLTATEAFTDSRRQHKIDVALQLSNEALHEVFAMGLVYKLASTATVTLVAGQREYDLPSDFERMAGEDKQYRVLRGATNGLTLSEYDGGYAAMLAQQAVASDFTGTPAAWALSPANFTIRMDAEPDTGDAGDTYNFLYERRIGFSSTMATEALPVSDTVADALVPAIAEAYSRSFKKDLDPDFLRGSLNRALDFLRQNQRRDRWGRRR